jgi:hypothetical protein
MSRPPPRSWWNIPGQLSDLARNPAGRIQLGLYLSVALIVFGGVGWLDRTYFSPLQVSATVNRMGWNEAAAKSEAPRIAASLPKFAITDDDGNAVSGAGKFAELWKFGKLANDGLHIPTWKQESGDCVSMGWSNAMAYRMAFQIANDQRNEVLKIPFPPYMYGVSRVWVGKRQLGRGAGSVGAWAAQGSLSYGVLPGERANELGFTYSGALADKWGWSGPPKETADYASKFRIKSIAQVLSWEDVRDALVHGYPVTVASNVGFEGAFRDADGKRWATAAGTWGHQMCFIGVEDRPRKIKGAYVINSWGSDAHPKPLNDEPPGGFWVGWQTVQRMVSQNDSWAYSDFDGFPDEGKADWNMFRARATARGVQTNVEAAEKPSPEPVLMEVRQMFSASILMCVAILGVLILAACLKFRFSYRTRGIMSLLLMAGLISVGVTADAAHRRQKTHHRQRQTTTQTMAQTPCACSPEQCAAGNCPPGCVCPDNANCASGSCRTSYGKKLDAERAKAAENQAVIPQPVSPAVEGDQKTWNAFAVRSQKQPVPVSWNAMAPKHELRTYRDCHDSEKDFILVVGSRETAERKLVTSDKPVAFEAQMPAVEPGSYRVFDMPGMGLRITRIDSQRTVAARQPRNQN